MNITIVPAEEKYIDSCIQEGIRGWKSVHKSYTACIGEDLHEELFGRWQEGKEERIRQTWRDGAFVALADDRVVGYVIYKINNILGKIQDNAVDPDFWGRGINTKLGFVCNLPSIKYYQWLDWPQCGGFGLPRQRHYQADVWAAD